MSGQKVKKITVVGGQSDASRSSECPTHILQYDPGQFRLKQFEIYQRRVVCNTDDFDVQQR